MKKILCLAIVSLFAASSMIQAKRDSIKDVDDTLVNKIFDAMVETELSQESKKELADDYIKERNAWVNELTKGKNLKNFTDSYIYSSDLLSDIDQYNIQNETITKTHREDAVTIKTGEVKALIRLYLLHSISKEIDLMKDINQDNYSVETPLKNQFQKTHFIIHNRILQLHRASQAARIPDGTIKRLVKKFGTPFTSAYSVAKAPFTLAWEHNPDTVTTTDSFKKYAVKTGIVAVPYAIGAAIAVGAYKLQKRWRILDRINKYIGIPISQSRAYNEADALMELKKENGEEFEDVLALLGTRFSEGNVQRILDVFDSIEDGTLEQVVAAE